MDLRLFWGVVKRYKRLSLGGLVLAVLLAVLGYGTPRLSHGRPTIVPRESPSYQATAQLLITQASGPYGRANANAVQSGDPGYMSSLSPIYAQLANSQTVKNAIRSIKIPGTVTTSEGVDPNTGAYTPFVTLVAAAPSKSDVRRLVTTAISSFQKYIAEMETNTGVPANQRVSLQVVDNGLPPVIVSGHKLMIPILVFVAVLVALVALLFSLENADPITAVALGRVSAVVQRTKDVAPYAPTNGAGTYGVEAGRNGHNGHLGDRGSLGHRSVASRRLPSGSVTSSSSTRPIPPEEARALAPEPTADVLSAAERVSNEGELE